MKDCWCGRFSVGEVNGEALCRDHRAVVVKLERKMGLRAKSYQADYRLLDLRYLAQKYLRDLKAGKL